MAISLTSHIETLREQTLLDLFQQFPERAEQFHIRHDGLSFDYSKNHLNAALQKDLCEFARQQKLPEAIQQLVNGDKVNNTEDRAALHTALRSQNKDSAQEQEVHATLAKMTSFVESVHSGTWQGFSGEKIDTIINIGIGGSDLGPRMVVDALADFHTPNLNIHFVANIDGCDLSAALKQARPETTLFIVASKSFNTLETLNNALSARQWIQNKGCTTSQLAQHFVAISANVSAAEAFGIAREQVFPIWDWVGGRYSLWSAIGLPIALAIGMTNFKALLSGAEQMDQHFIRTEFENNMPVMAALVSYWYSQYWGACSHAVLPYASRLARLPAYLQQLDMESLGKRVDKSGRELEGNSGLVIWGTEGTNGQHSFHQLLHQGTQLIPVDFIAVKQSMSQYKQQHEHLLSCCVSQAQALLQGKNAQQAEMELLSQGLTEDEAKKLVPHKVIPGNKPSNLFILDALTPANVGALIAFYEHKVYVSSVLLGINAFDQWGVELGKQLGEPIHEAMAKGEIDENWDSSTQSAIRRLRN